MSITAYAHNTDRSGPDQTIPVIAEIDSRWPFIPAEELERDWHVATEDEYIAYLDYWDAVYDKEGG